MPANLRALATVVLLYIFAAGCAAAKTPGGPAYFDTSSDSAYSADERYPPKLTMPCGDFIDEQRMVGNPLPEQVFHALRYAPDLDEAMRIIDAAERMANNAPKTAQVFASLRRDTTALLQTLSKYPSDLAYVRTFRASNANFVRDCASSVDETIGGALFAEGVRAHNTGPGMAAFFAWDERWQDAVNVLTGYGNIDNKPLSTDAANMLGFSDIALFNDHVRARKAYKKEDADYAAGVAERKRRHQEFDRAYQNKQEQEGTYQCGRRDMNYDKSDNTCVER